MRNEIYAYTAQPQILQNEKQIRKEGRFVKLENFANGKTDYVSALFSNAKGFNVAERTYYQNRYFN